MVTISKYYSSVTKTGVRPSNPGNVVTVIPEVLNPPDSPVNHSPVTIGSPANGLSLVGQELSLGLASSGVTGALSGTDWSTFNGKLNLTSPITGYVIGANTALLATDTILGAFGKIQGQIGARVSGTIASGQVAFGTGVNTVGGDSGLLWDNVNKILSLTTVSDVKLILAGRANSDLITSNNASIVTSGTGGAAYPFTTGGNLVLTSRKANSLDIVFRTGLSSNNLMVLKGTSLVGILTNSPTDTLDVNGTTRIRTIANATGNFLTTSATGVVQQRTAGEVATDIGAVTITGTQTITGAKTFDNSLLVLSGASPVFRIASNNNLATLNFRANDANEKATLEFSDATNAFSIATRVNNSDISITPHGTGKIKLSNVPSGSGDVLMRDASNNLVKSSALSAYKLLDEDITPTAFTSATFATILTGGILGTNSFDGAVNASYEGSLWIRSVDDASSTFDLRFSIWSQNIDVNISLGTGSQTWMTLVRFKLIVQGGIFTIIGQTITMLEASNFENVKNINYSGTTYSSTGTVSIDLQARCLGIGPPTIYPISFILKQTL